MFSSEIWETFKNNYLEEHLAMAASDKGHIKNVLLLNFKRCHMLPHCRHANKILNTKLYDSELAVYLTKYTSKEIKQQKLEKASYQQVSTTKILRKLNSIMDVKCLVILYH